MLTVLLLAGVEKLINIAIASDNITKSGLAPLTGKVLRLDMAKPEFRIDVLFNDDHIRFEPVTTSIFESMFESVKPRANANDQPSDSANRNNYDIKHADIRQTNIDQEQRRLSGIGHSTPECTIKVANPAELLNLLRSPEGNLPIEGDYKVLMQVKQLLAGFNPDIAGQLEPLIGKPLASQLSLLINSLKGGVKHTAKNTFNDVADWANDVAGNSAPDPEMTAEANDLKQQLLKLRADIEREQARLAMIKAEQAQAQQQ